MKFRHLTLLIAIALIGVTACDDGESEVEGLTLSQDTYEVEQSGGSMILTLHSSSDWTAESSADWVTSGMTQAVKAQKTTKITVAENMGDARTATITFRNSGYTATLTVTQAELPYTLTVDPSLDFEHKGGTLTLNINSTRDWTVSCSASWLSFSPASAEQTVTSTSVTAEPLADGEPDRSAKITVKTPNGEQTVTVTQHAYVEPETVMTLKEAITQAGSGKSVRVEAHVGAVSKEAIVLSDDSRGLLIKNPANPLDYTIGDMVEICGKVAYEDKVACISDVDIEKKISDGSASDAVYPIPVRMTKREAHYYGSERPQYYPKHMIVSGKLTVEDGVYKVAIPANGTNYPSGEAEGILYEPTSSQKTQLDALNGKYIAFNGFVCAVTEGNVMHIMPLTIVDRDGENAFWTPIYHPKGTLHYNIGDHSSEVTYPVGNDYSEFKVKALNGDPWVWMDEIMCPPEGQVLEFEYKSNIDYWITIYWLAKSGDGPNPAYLYPGEDRGDNHKFMASSDWKKVRLDCTGKLPSFFGYTTACRMDFGWDANLELSIRHMRWTK